MENLEEIGKIVKESARKLNNMRSEEKNIILRKVAEQIIENQQDILDANKIDVENAIKNNTPIITSSCNNILFFVSSIFLNSNKFSSAILL